MRTLHIIMPMAGEGSRFKEAGYTVPKPLIKVEGKELYRHALDSILFDCNTNSFTMLAVNLASSVLSKGLHFKGLGS